METQELTPETVRQNLKDAGFAPQAAAGFLDCWQAGDRREQMRLLAKQRSCLFQRIHKQEKQISCLDYLAYCLCHPATDEDKGEMTHL